MIDTLRTYGMFALIAIFIAFPFFAAAQSDPYAFKSQGLFGCNLNGAYAMSVGTMSAIGGVYVPVNDAAVTLNTGILVYKECVLREVVDAERMAALAAIEKNEFVAFQTGSGGRGSYPKVLAKDELELASDPTALDFLEKGLESEPAALKGILKRAAAQGYLTGTRNAASMYTCPYKGDLTAAWSGQDTSPEAVLATFDPRCDPVFAFHLVQEARNLAISRCLNEMLARLQWNQGIYDVTEDNKVCNGTVLTPGILVKDTVSTDIQSGANQLRTANDLGQMPSALYSAFSTQIAADGRGLAGTLQGLGGQPSYLDQVVAEQSANVRGAAVNAAIQILAAAKQIETQFLQIVSNIANILTQTINQLRSMENQCWGFIIQKVCTAPPDANNNCTSPQGDRLHVATSTAFSQAVIDAQITPLATPAINNVNAAQAAVRLIDQLIQSITNTNSLDAQRLALQQLDSLVAQHKIHNQYDLQNAQSQQQAVQDSMKALIDKTKTDWADSNDPNVGWCNVNNQAVINMWIQRWKI